MQMILDKIRIPNEINRILRPRLLTELQNSMASCTSTIINGRAGSGKTMLAADFALNCRRSVAWFKVDATDNDRRLFFRYLAESVRAQRAGFSFDDFMNLVETTKIKDMPLLAESFIYELQKNWNHPLLIVIDDLHLVFDADWAVPFFARLLPLLPVHVHVLITGRSLPPAPLWRMRSKQILRVIDEGSLAFSNVEAKDLFVSYGLTSEQAETALKQTRGRAFTLDTLAQLLATKETLKHSRATKTGEPRVLEHVHAAAW